MKNQGQGLIGIIIALVIVGLIVGGLYYYFSKQTIEETIKPEEKLITEEKTHLKEITSDLLVDFFDWFKSSTVIPSIRLKAYSIDNINIDEIGDNCFAATVDYSIETSVKSNYWKTGSWAYNQKLFADIVKDGENYKIRDLGTGKSITSYWGVTGWKTYRNDEYGFEVQYPEDGEIVESQFRDTTRINLPYILGTTLSEKYLIIKGEQAAIEECSNPMSTRVIKTETVYFNGIEFKKEIGNENAMGSIYDSVSYSTIRENQCIGLGFALVSFNTGAISSGVDIPPDYSMEKESAIFDQIMSTFRFLE
jgi:hypothetical protein